MEQTALLVAVIVVPVQAPQAECHLQLGILTTPVTVVSHEVHLIPEFAPASHDTTFAATQFVNVHFVQLAPVP